MHPMDHGFSNSHEIEGSHVAGNELNRKPGIEYKVQDNWIDFFIFDGCLPRLFSRPDYILSEAFNECATVLV